jgi:hypothetical protein
MKPDAVAAIATVILLFPMGYFLLASPAFLFVKLDIQPVALLLRGLFKAYFLMMGIVGVIGTVALVAAGRPVFAVGIGLIAAFAIWGGRWFLRQMDAQLAAGDAAATRRLRRLHWGGMLCNVIQIVAIVSCIPYVFVTSAA